MGFRCFASGEIVENQRMILVPIEVRKVRYVGVFKPNPKEDFLQFGASSEGWEIAKEVPVAEKNHEAFMAAGQEPKVIGEKEVRYIMPRKKKDKKPQKTSRYDEDDEKPELEEQE